VAAPGWEMPGTGVRHPRAEPVLALGDEGARVEDLGFGCVQCGGHAGPGGDDGAADGVQRGGEGDPGRVDAVAGGGADDDEPDGLVDDQVGP